jgi:hypothetical protein
MVSKIDSAVKGSKPTSRHSLPKWKVWIFRLLTAGIVGVVCLLSGEVSVRIVAPQNLSGT